MTAGQPSSGKRRWRDYRTASGRRPVRDFIASLTDSEAADVVAAMKDVSRNGLAAARHVDDYEPDPADERDPKAYQALRQAALSRSAVEKDIVEAVKQARADGYSWSLIGSLLGTTGEAARQRYGAIGA